uniref:Uncharacterized protein n=1 Tax=viral metagenome TaxID=1070528 RepID=A0A6C0KW90_9ZZZZ
MELLEQVIIVSGILFGLIIIFQAFNTESSDTTDTKVLLGTATIEAMENGRVGPNPDLATDMSEFDAQRKLEHSFCEFNGGNLQNLEIECNNLSKTNCSKVKCCGYLNQEKCVTGNKFGPTYRSDKSGNNIEIDTYYYMNKCSGPKCPKGE